MDKYTLMALVVLGIVAIVVIVSLGGRIKRFSLKFLGMGGVDVSTHPTPAPPRPGISMDGIKAGGSVTADAKSGDIAMKQIEAVGDVKARADGRTASGPKA